MCEEININVNETNENINIVSNEIVENIDINVDEISEDVTLNITEEIIQVKIQKTIGGLQSIVAGNNILVDNTDELNPIINADLTGFATETYVDNGLYNKVDKILGKGLSTEDYTTTEKNKLAGIEEGAEVNVNADWSATSGDAQILNKPIIPAAQIQSDWEQTNITALDYIKNKPIIPTGSGLKHITASGTDTYISTVTGVTSYSDGDAYLVRFTNGNTTGCTLNINSLGAITLYRNNDGALIGGDIQAGSEMLCVYNSTANNFQCIGTSPNSIIAYVTNADSVTITKGQPVYAFGGTGDRMTVKRALNTGDSTSAQTVGLVMSSSIASNQKGFIILQGLLDGLSILPTSTFADGNAVYLGSTAGSITNVKPYAPNHLVYLGVVTTASNGSAGRMYVRVQNGYELDELHNVQAQSPSNNDTLYYDNSVSQWKTASLSTILGYTPVTNARTISTTSPLSGGGDLTANRTLSISQSTTSTNGYLSSTDWNTFNNKQNASTRKNANNSTNNNINYCGVALGTGVSESSSIWTITRLTISSLGAVTLATANNVKWTDRETVIYT